MVKVTKDVTNLSSQKNVKTAIDISTRSVEDSDSILTNPVTKDILDTILDWVSTPTSSPTKAPDEMNQIERTTSVDKNIPLMDGNNIRGESNGYQEMVHNSMRLVTTKVFCSKCGASIMYLLSN